MVIPTQFLEARRETNHRTSRRVSHYDEQDEGGNETMYDNTKKGGYDRDDAEFNSNILAVADGKIHACAPLDRIFDAKKVCENESRTSVCEQDCTSGIKSGNATKKCGHGDCKRQTILGQIAHFFNKVDGANKHPKECTNFDKLEESKMKILEKNPIHRYVILPHGEYRTCWDLYIAFLLLYVGAFVPYRVSFLGELSDSMNNFELFVDVSFGVDVILNFLTGKKVETSSRSALATSPHQSAYLYVFIQNLHSLRAVRWTNRM